MLRLVHVGELDGHVEGLARRVRSSDRVNPAGRTIRPTVLAIVLVLSAAVPAFADAGDEPETPNGKAYFSDGLSAFKRGDHAAASRAFAAGYAAEKWNGFLFAWAQAERIAGNCTKAIELYSRFIATKPKPDAREHAVGWIKVCGGEYVEPPPDPPAPDPPKPPAPVKYERVARTAPGFHHKLAVGLGVAAIASSIAAVRFLTWADRDFDAADAETVYGEVARVHDRAERRLLFGRLAIGAGLGLATASVLRLVFHRAPTRFELVPVGGGAVVTGRF
jgi:hypothetical protein